MAAGTFPEKAGNTVEAVARPRSEFVLAENDLM
jgi:hypothetical protein